MYDKLQAIFFQEGLSEMKKVLLAGSSHTRFFYPFVKRSLEGVAIVSKLPYDAGRTDEILDSLHDWPLEGQDVVHLYSGHRDLMLDNNGRPVITPEEFRSNLQKIISMISSRTDARVVLSNVPPVSEAILAEDGDRNHRIMSYNGIIYEIAGEFEIPVHDFWGFVLNHHDREGLYLDGLHFRRELYREFAESLSDFLTGLLCTT